MKSILITGCSSGIGLDAAQRLKSEGWRVFAACRQQKDCDRLAEMGFDSPRLDYTDQASLEQALAEVLEATGGTLDALFNNGAHPLNGLVEDLQTDGLRAIFEANFFGWHELTRRVVPVMRAQGHGHIVQCSSTLGLGYITFRGAYAASKHALEALSDTMRVELRETGIKVVLIEPGPIPTAFRRNGIPWFERFVDWKASAQRARYENVLIPRLYAEDLPPDRFELPPSAVSDALVRALGTDNPHPRYFVTKATWIMAIFMRLLPTRSVDRIVANL
ncbi:MAG: SDR family NAD(P)-dependent oxidoreductase [Pseudomonadota bacterium]